MTARLEVSSDAFAPGDWIPEMYTGRGADISPGFILDGLDEAAVSIAITLDDASHPLFPNYNHWLIWNLPVRRRIPAAIPGAKTVAALGGAVQGRAYGRHRYRGPKPPFSAVHTYVFTVYVLECRCDLPPQSRKAGLLAAMEGHILQQATLAGKFQSRRQKSGKKGGEKDGL